MKSLKLYVEALTVLDYRVNGLKPFLEVFIPQSELTLFDEMKRKRMERAFKRYDSIGSKKWKNSPDGVKDILLDLLATKRLAANYAEDLLPDFIDVLQRDRKNLTKLSMELFFEALQTSARPEAQFQDFAKHIKEELDLIHPSEINLEFEESLFLIHPGNKKDYDLDHYFYRELGLESAPEAKEFHVFLFRWSLFKQLTDAIKYFDLTDENDRGYFSD